MSVYHQMLQDILILKQILFFLGLPLLHIQWNYVATLGSIHDTPLNSLYHQKVSRTFFLTLGVWLCRLYLLIINLLKQERSEIVQLFLLSTDWDWVISFCIIYLSSKTTHCDPWKIIIFSLLLSDWYIFVICIWTLTFLVFLARIPQSTCW